MLPIWYPGGFLRQWIVLLTFPAIYTEYAAPLLLGALVQTTAWAKVVRACWKQVLRAGPCLRVLKIAVGAFSKWVIATVRNIPSVACAFDWGSARWRVQDNDWDAWLLQTSPVQSMLHQTPLRSSGSAGSLCRRECASENQNLLLQSLQSLM